MQYKLTHSGYVVILLAKQEHIDTDMRLCTVSSQGLVKSVTRLQQRGLLVGAIQLRILTHSQ
jgi:hypothetical protein